MWHRHNGLYAMQYKSKTKRNILGRNFDIWAEGILVKSAAIRGNTIVDLLGISIKMPFLEIAKIPRKSIRDLLLRSVTPYEEIWSNAKECNRWSQWKISDEGENLSTESSTCQHLRKIKQNRGEDEKIQFIQNTQHKKKGFAAFQKSFSCN